MLRAGANPVRSVFRVTLLHLSLVALNALVARVRLDLVVPDSVRLGEEVPISLRMTNTGRNSATVYLQGRPTAFDIIVTREDGTPVWRRLKRAVVTAILQVRVLSPGETLDFTEHWSQKTDSGEAVPPGEYRVVGVLPTDPPAELRTEPAHLRILP